jgi:hypothetical protein
LKILEVKESEFSDYIRKQNNYDQLFMPWLIEDLIAKGITREPNKVYAFAPHPIFSGKITPENIMVMDLFPWISICAQLHKGS